MENLEEMWVSSRMKVYSPVWKVGDRCRLNGGFAKYKVTAVKGNGLYEIVLDDKELEKYRPDLPKVAVVKGYRMREVSYSYCTEADLEYKGIVKCG